MPRGRFRIGESDAALLREAHRAVESLGFTYSHVEYPTDRTVRVYFKLPGGFNGMTHVQVDDLKHRSAREVRESAPREVVAKHDLLRKFDEAMCTWAAGRLQRIYHTTLPHGLHAAVELKSLFNAEKELLQGLKAGG